ncbi:LANO_0B04720g1_1 [Lachancea nothofagi CBS 11611]|uniref:LANO_0B04720g1_1 n=1 Tax=Lachancea nothofagi CBS 11611 TaxID=1266666 RepID=A0A1G4IXT0_9SACH|nr:LANO_0B04720g1_1 [Lachancea nothofagi CBS 11611]
MVYVRFFKSSYFLSSTTLVYFYIKHSKIISLITSSTHTIEKFRHRANIPSHSPPHSMPAIQLLILAILALRAGCFSIAGNSQSSFPWLTVNRDTTGLYFVNASVGSPGQLQMLRVDVVQPYLWIFSNKLEESREEDNEDVSDSTFYDPSKSTTSQNIFNNEVFEIQFMDHISYNASTYMDTVEFLYDSSQINESQAQATTNDSGNTISWSGNSSTLQFQKTSFFNADSVALFLQQGALGLGGKIHYQGDASDSSNYNESFFFLDQMVGQGLINSSSYSLWLGGDTSDPLVASNLLNQCGSIILGGVDQSLYTGDFVKFDTLPFYDPRTQQTSRGYPIIPLSKVDVQSKSGQILNLTSEYFLEPVLLDSRYRYNYLPLNLIVQIAMQANAYYVDSLDRWLLSCEVGSMGASILFEFGNLVISVPLSDMMGPTFDSATNDTLHFSNSQPACELRVLPNTNAGFSILGGPFIKNVYLAAELESHQIALAQASTLSRSTSLSTTKASSSSSTLSHSTASTADDNSTNYKLRFATKVPEFDVKDNPSAIRSGIIPFATTNNYSSYETLILYATASVALMSDSKIMNQFTATISSDGVIFTGRSFYNTSYSSSPSSTSASSKKQSNSAERNTFIKGSATTSLRTYILLFLLPLVLTMTIVI